MQQQADSTRDTQPTGKQKDNPLQLAGISYVVGDVALAVSGLVKHLGGPVKDHTAAKLTVATGALWGAGGAAAMLFGNPDKNTQLEILAHKLKNHLEANGARISDSMRDNTLLADKGFFSAIHRFMSEHPSEILNTAYAIGAGTLLSTGLKKHSDSNELWMGALVMAGALGGLLIKEDPDARQKAAGKGPLAEAYAYLQEKPLRFSGTAYGLNNIFTVTRALGEYKTHKGTDFKYGLKPYWFSTLTAASYVLANAMLFMSPRSQIEKQEFSPDDLNQLEQVAAEIIGAQPKETQKILLQSVAEYLAEEKSIPISAEHLAEQLNQRIDQVKERRIGAVVERGWRSRHEAQRRLQETQEPTIS